MSSMSLISSVKNLFQLTWKDNGHYQWDTLLQYLSKLEQLSNKQMRFCFSAVRVSCISVKTCNFRVSSFARWCKNNNQARYKIIPSFSCLVSVKHTCQKLLEPNDHFDVVDVERSRTSTSRTAADERLSSEEVQVEHVSVAEISELTTGIETRTISTSLGQ